MTARKGSREALTAERVARLHTIELEIRRFSRQCQREEYTDTEQAWQLLSWILSRIRELKKVK